eukprot:Tamp_10135.p1 GENE.Tamp_10135~~Tamp_10135.p1  ORF type:complete len:378 (-),score=71.32 Tamp_10135:945-2051(-)
MSVGGISLSSSLHGRLGDGRRGDAALPYAPERQKPTPAQVLGMASLFDGDHPAQWQDSAYPQVPMYGMQSGPTYGMQSGPSAADTMRQLQMLQSQQEERMRQEQYRTRTEGAMLAQLDNELKESKAEIERMRASLEEIGKEGGPVARMSEEYRSYRGLMEEREEGHRRLWKEEENRVKVLTEETKSRLKIVRDHLIGTLDHVDVSNRAMMEAMDQLLRIDYEMCQTYGDRVPQAMAHMAVPTSPPTANATVVAQGGGTLLGQDLSGHGKVEQAGLGLGPVFPSAQKPHTGLPPATSLVGRNLNDMVKSGYGENARIISDVIQPASVSPVNSAGAANAPTTPKQDADSFRQQLVASGYVRASEDLSSFA